MSLMSNYPDGFKEGLILAGIPLVGTKAGNTYWVDSNIGSTSYKGTHPKRALTTLDAAIGKCIANNGDLIFIAPGHTESLAADSAVDIDVAGITVIGLGKGEDRPIFTFATDTDADFKIAAANTAIYNMVFKCNIAAQEMMIEVTGDDAQIGHCEFREGSAQSKTCITVGVADNDADRCYIHDCKFYVPTAGDGDAAISLAKDMAGVRIERCDIYGDFDLAGIDIPAGGNAQVDVKIDDCRITNLLTGQHAIQINGTGSTGMLSKIYCVTDALATSIDAGGCEMFDCYHNVGTDQGGWEPIVDSDSANDILGADNNNNAFASTNVASNRDGSIIERTETTIAGIFDAVSEPPTAKSLHDILHKDGSYTFDNTTDSLEAIADALIVVDAFHDIGTADATTNVVMSDVVGNKTDAAATVAATKSLVAYAKQNVNQTLKLDGVTIATAPTAASLASFIASGGTSLGTQLPATCSLYDVLAGANGVPVFPAAAAPANTVSIAEVEREIYDQMEKGISGATAVMTNGDTIFTIAGGPIEIMELVSECITLNDATASTLQYSADPTVGAATTFSGASGSLANAAAGSGVVLNQTALATAPDLVDPLVCLSGVNARGIIVGAGIITIVIGVGTTTGTWKHFLRYRPLGRGVTVTAT